MAIDGRLEWREWETKEGAKRQDIDIIAESVQFLSSRNDGDGGEPSGAEQDFVPVPAGVAAGTSDDDIPF